MIAVANRDSIWDKEEWDSEAKLSVTKAWEEAEMNKSPERFTLPSYVEQEEEEEVVPRVKKRNRLRTVFIEESAEEADSDESSVVRSDSLSVAHISLSSSSSEMKINALVFNAAADEEQGNEEVDLADYDDEEQGMKGEEITPAVGMPANFNDIVKWVMDKKADGEEVITRVGDVDLKRKDFACLGKKEWLTDDIIDCYLSLVIQRASMKCILLSTHFYGILSRGEDKYDPTGAYQFVQDMAIWEYEKVLIPIHQGVREHWVLAVVDLKNSMFCLYDPMCKNVTECPELALLARFFTQLARNTGVLANPDLWKQSSRT